MKPIRIVIALLFVVLLGFGLMFVRRNRTFNLPALPPTTAEARATRQSLITTVAPAPLPTGLPLVGREGVTADGYPTQYVDEAALRSLLWHGEFATLSKDIEELQSRFEEDPKREYWPIDASSAFGSAEPDLDASLDAWAKATPSSFAPYLARGAHRTAVAFARRGGKWAKDTPAEDMAAMKQGLADAMEDLDHARALRPKLVAAMRQQLHVLLLAPAGHDLSKVIGDAVAVCPSCFQVRVTYIFDLLPRWNGSYAQMDAFAGQSADPRWPRLAALAGYADEDRADLLHKNHKDDEALETANKALAHGETPDFLLMRAKAYISKKNFDAARLDLDKALELWPNFEPARFRRAWLAWSVRQWEAAGQDLLFGLRVDPTDSEGRSIFDNVVAGLVFEGWERFKAGKRDDALRIYDLAADLAPTNGELLSRRPWVIVGHEGATVDEAIASAEAALRAHPGDFRATQELDYDLSRKGAFVQILPLWDSYLAAHPDDGPAHMERAGTLHNLGRDADARAEAAKACSLGISRGCVRAVQ